jgi:hypothetical protein
LKYKEALESRVTEVVGFPAQTYWVASCLSGVGKGHSYQIMPSCEAEEIREVFWDWRLDRNRQFYLTPLEAAAALVRAWRARVREKRGRS